MVIRWNWQGKWSWAAPIVVWVASGVLSSQFLYLYMVWTQPGDVVVPQNVPMDFGVVGYMIGFFPAVLVRWLVRRKPEFASRVLQVVINYWFGVLIFSVALECVRGKFPSSLFLMPLGLVSAPFAAPLAVALGLVLIIAVLLTGIPTEGLAEGLGSFMPAFVGLAVFFVLLLIVYATTPQMSSRKGEKVSGAEGTG